MTLLRYVEDEDEKDDDFAYVSHNWDRKFYTIPPHLQ